MEEISQELPDIELKDKADTSFKVIYKFIKAWVEFYESKNKEKDNEEKSFCSSITDIQPNM